MKKGMEKLRRKFEEDPITFIIVASFALTASAKFIDSVSGVQSRRAYAKKFNSK